MYQVLEDTPYRLVIKIGYWGASMLCELDKATGLATIKRHAYTVIPLPVLTIPFADVRELIHVSVPRSASGADSIVLVLRSGRRRWLPADTAEDSIAAAQRMSAFLGLAAPRSQSVLSGFEDKGPRRYFWVGLRWSWYVVTFGLGAVGIVTGAVLLASALFGEQNVRDFLHGRW